MPPPPATSLVWDLPRSWAEALRPPPVRTPDEWALANRKLDPGDAESGPLDHSRTPYITPIIRAIASRRYYQVVAVMGAQMAKTAGILSVMGHRLDDDPVPILYVGPDKAFITDQFEPRLSAMIRGTASLSEKLLKGKREKQTLKIVAGVKVRLAWAGSASQLSSDPFGLAFVDDRDRMDRLKGKGDPVELVRARGRTFRESFVLGVFGTPEIGLVTEEKHPETGVIHWGEVIPEKVESKTWRLFGEGTRCEWAWPCPDCDHYFVPRFSRLKWPKGSTLEEARRLAYVECPDCETHITDVMKFDLNARGAYISPGQRVLPGGVTEGEGVISKSASYWVSGLCSPFHTFGDIAHDFLVAARSTDPDRIQGVVNTGLGELFHVAGEAPKWESVAALREPYRFDEVPAAVRFVTSGVDVQKNRLVFVVRGWGYRMESWLLRHGEIYGETDLDPVWADLAELLRASWGPRHLPIRQMLVDSGFRPGDRWRRPEHVVYRFCARFPGYVRSSKGHDDLEQPVKLVKIDVTVANRVIPKAVELVHVNTDYFKSWLHGRIAWPVGEPGAWHLSQDATDAYCAEITSEARLVTASGRAKWIRHRRDNHALDCEVLATAAAYLLGVHLLRDEQSTDGDVAPRASGRRLRSPGIQL